MQWEYQVVRVKLLRDGNVQVVGPDKRSRGLAPVLFAEGEKGWDLVQVWDIPKSEIAALIFKRPNVQPAPEAL